MYLNVFHKVWMYLNLFYWVWMHFNVFECVSVCFSKFKCVWVCEMQTYCWVVHLVGWRGTRVVELACWGQINFWYELSFFFVFDHGFYLKQTFSTFLFCQGPFDLFPLCQFLTFPKGDCRENVTRFANSFKKLPAFIVDVNLKANIIVNANASYIFFYKDANFPKMSVSWSSKLAKWWQ